MHMRVNQPGQHKRAVQVDGLCAGQRDILNIVVAAHRHDAPMRNCNRRSAGLRRVHRVNRCVIEDVVHRVVVDQFA